MNIYKLTQNINNGYDSIIVIAKNEEKARQIHPDNENLWESPFNFWANSPKQITVKFIGTTKMKKEEIILASFNAG